MDRYINSVPASNQLRYSWNNGESYADHFETTVGWSGLILSSYLLLAIMTYLVNSKKMERIVVYGRITQSQTRFPRQM